MKRNNKYEINKVFGSNVRQARLLRNLSQDKFAELIGVESPTLSNIERGISAPTKQTFEKIIEVLDIVPYLLYMSDKDINAEKVYKEAVKQLEKLKNNKTLLRRAYDYILELSHGI